MDISGSAPSFLPLAATAFGFWSVVPPLFAILLAIATRRILVSLTAGIFVGSLILSRGNLLAATGSTFESHLWQSLIDPDHLRVFVFTLLMGAMVGVMQRSGGMEAIVQGMSPLARTRRGGQLIVWLLGLVVFFDDYANTLLLGNTMRPLTDRLRISREKLAYLVDSTAAPVSGLALISTWVAGELGYISAGFAGTPLEQDASPLAIFIETIPYRFYVLWALILVPMIGVLGRDFGPMLRAERRALEHPVADTAEGQAANSWRWLNAVVPIVAVVLVTLALIAATGSRALADAPADQRTAINVFNAGDSYLALVYGSLAGLILAMLLAFLLTSAPWTEISEASFQGARQVLVALAILWLSWALSGQTSEQYLNTGQYLGEKLQGALHASWLPTLVFIVSGAVAFSTGTSWGTMGILMPIVVPTVIRVTSAQGEVVGLHDPILIGSIGSVLAGAIFGDHCSPISDTTVLSSQASGCNHVAHVRTQLPYALLAAGISILFGTMPVGFGLSVWWLLPAGTVALWLWVIFVGRRVA